KPTLNVVLGNDVRSTSLSMIFGKNKKRGKVSFTSAPYSKISKKVFLLFLYFADDEPIFPRMLTFKTSAPLNTLLNKYPKLPSIPKSCMFEWVTSIVGVNIARGLGFNVMFAINVLPKLSRVSGTYSIDGYLNTFKLLNEREVIERRISEKYPSLSIKIALLSTLGL